MQVIRIFDSILSPKLAEFDGEIKPLAAHIAQATLRVSEADKHLANKEPPCHVPDIFILTPVRHAVLQLKSSE